MCKCLVLMILETEGGRLLFFSKGNSLPSRSRDGEVSPCYCSINKSHLDKKPSCKFSSTLFVVTAVKFTGQ
ncbi:hypothetical protein POPTR_009G097750v4 [Populus trichocarpa]|uniref:Uncharacterized protein n=1 Tax=Populus trichocarpa TaxID=3694 RepID=A0ACC0SHD6_POPTR|nr:hypothetical protein POPTR_009G097750v4 [Populus trichocarpa]